MNELIQLIKVIDSDILSELNSYIDTLTFSPCPIFDDKSEILSVGRTSTGLVLDNEVDIVKKFHHSINNGLVEYKRRIEKIHGNFSYYPVPGAENTKSWREPIQILQYEKTQEYKFHHDTIDNPQIKEYYRKISVIVYLTDDFSGGATAFTFSKLKPPPGYAIIFPSNWCYPHAGEPVTDGMKRVAVTWYYSELS
tara:strand:+ start:1815 stop:2399 length:585 start_codon:yes stop_codon:yes gene_type:complete